MENIPPWTQLIENPKQFIPLQPPKPIQEASHSGCRKRNISNTLDSEGAGDENSSTCRPTSEYITDGKGEDKGRERENVSKGTDRKRRRSAEVSESSSLISSKRYKGATAFDDKEPRTRLSLTSKKNRSRSPKSKSRSRRLHRDRARSPRLNRDRSRSRSNRSLSRLPRSNRSRSRSLKSDRSRLRSNRNRSRSPVLRKAASKRKRLTSRSSVTKSSSPEVLTGKTNLVPYRNSNSVSPERLPLKKQESEVLVISSPSTVTSLSDDEIATSGSPTKEASKNSASVMDMVRLSELLELSSQYFDKALLRKQLGEELFKEFKRQVSLACSKLEEEFEVYRTMPDMYDKFEDYYENFMKTYLLEYPNEDEEHKDRLWRKFWKSKFQYVKECELERRVLDLIKEYYKKVDLVAFPKEEIASSSFQIPACHSLSLSSVPSGPSFPISPLEAKRSLKEVTKGSSKDSRREPDSKPKTKSPVKEVTREMITSPISKSCRSKSPNNSVKSQSRTSSTQLHHRIKEERPSSISKVSPFSTSEQKGSLAKDGSHEIKISCSKSTSKSKKHRRSPDSSRKLTSNWQTSEKEPKLVKEYKNSKKEAVNIKKISLVVDNALNLLESMIPDLGVLGHSIASIVWKAKDLGRNTSYAVKLFTDSESIELFEMALKKIKLKYEAEGKSDFINDVKKTIKHLMDYAQSAQTMEREAYQSEKQKSSLNIHAIAVSTMNKDTTSILKKIQIASKYEGLILNSEEINKIFREVCSIHLQMAGKI